MTKIYKDKKNKNERLTIVLDIVKKLKSFYSSEHTIIDLYNPQFPTIINLKSIFNEYINQDDSHPSLIYGLNGTLRLKKSFIHYLLKKIANPSLY